jgi:hypothetical protein
MCVLSSPPSRCGNGLSHKIDRLAYHVSCIALAARTPLLPSFPPPRQRNALWPIVVRLLLSYIAPLLGTVLLLLRHALGRLWEDRSPCSDGRPRNHLPRCACCRHQGASPVSPSSPPSRMTRPVSRYPNSR